LMNTALESGLLMWNLETKLNEVSEYVKENRTEFLDIVNFRPNLWACRSHPIFRGDLKCLIESLDSHK